MCQFLSALVLRNGDVLCDPEHTDSHEDLILAANLRDDRQVGDAAFVRVELVPPSDSTVVDVSVWQFLVDQTETPDWWPERAERAETRLRAIASAMIVTDERSLLLGGCWILAENARVDLVRNARIVTMHGSSQVDGMSCSSQVDGMYDSSRVGGMYGSSRVGNMYDWSQVGDMHESSRVGDMHESSRVGNMYDLSQVRVMYDSSRVEYMHGSSQVGYVYDSSRVEYMRDSSRVGYMYDSSRVGYMHGSSQVGYMYGLANVGNVRDSATTPRL